MFAGREARGWIALCCLLIAAALAVPAAAVAGQRIQFDLPSPLVDTTTPGGQLEKDRAVPKVNVLLPDGYDPRSERGYPILWMLHGANGGTDSWFGPNTDIETLVGKGFPGIIVMPDGGLFGMYMDWFNGGARGGPAWNPFHLKLLRRLVHRRFPIRPGRRWHAIGGISMGGQGTLRYAAVLPGYFGSAATFSAALPDMQSIEAQGGLDLLAQAGGSGATYNQIFGPADAPYAEGNSPLALAPNYEHTRLYLTSGNGVNCPQDPVNPNSIALDIVTESALHGQQAPFAAALREQGADVTEKTTCGVHTFGVWDRAIPDAVDTWGFFKPVPERPRSWTYRTVARSGDMWGLRFRFASAPESVARFERAGRALAGDGAGTVRLAAGKGCRLTVTLPFEQRLPRPCR